MLPSLAFELPSFLLGLLLGSFLNVCISRLPAHRSLIRPGSHCPRCLAPIRWYDNVPLLSWILLGAKCRSCKGAIPFRYPLVELATALWFALAAWTLPAAASNSATMVIHGVALAILGFLLIGLLVMDWQTHLLPDAFTLTGTLLGFVLVWIQALFLGPHEDELLLHGRNPLTSPGNVVDRGNVILTGPEHLILGRLLAIVLAAGLIIVVRATYKALRHREGLGLGDAKLMAMIAAFLGFWPAMLSLFAGVLVAAAYSIVLLARRRATSLTAIPLGTFLCLGGLLAALASTPLITWYTSLF